MRRLAFVLLAVLMIIPPLAFCQESLTYSVTIRSCGNETKTIEGVTSHSVILDNKVMSIRRKDGRRYLFSMEGKDFEFSHELDLILEKQEKSGK